jgi:hypothetical protein
MRWQLQGVRARGAGRSLQVQLRCGHPWFGWVRVRVQPVLSEELLKSDHGIDAVKQVSYISVVYRNWGLTAIVVV